MINFLSNWIEQIALAVIIASIFELILPNGNIKKYVKMILGIYVVFCIISPFVNSSNLYSFSEDSISKYIENVTNEKATSLDQTSMDNRIQSLYIEELENNIKSKIKDNGYELLNCKIDADLLNSSNNPGIHKISLTVSKNTPSTNKIEKIEVSIGEKLQSENKEESEETQKLSKLIAEEYGVDENIITIKIN